jgi:glycopeptide antibiotics resistance protein
MPFTPSRRTRTVLSRLAYVAVIALATLTGLDFDPSLADVPARWHRAFVVLPHLTNGSDYVDGARNLLLFAGLGAVWIATSRLARPWLTITRVTVIGFLLSCTVETIQLFSPLRDSSIIDVTTNTVGGLLGAAFTYWVLTLVQRRRGTRMYVGVPAAIFAFAYGIAIAAEAFFPLLREPTLPNITSGVRSRLALGWSTFDWSSLGALPITDLFLYAPAGAFAVAAAAEAGVSLSMAWPIIALIGALAVWIIEVVHTVVLEPIDAGAVLVHVIAITAGAFAAARLLPRFARYAAARRPLYLLAGYAVVVAMWSWRPFRIEVSAAAMREQFSRDHLIPLAALAVRGDMFSVTDVIAQALLFLPIGALLAVWPLRRSGPLRKLVPALYLSVVLEVGKILVADRFMDVTHVLIQCAGAGIGYALMRLAGFVPYGALLEPGAESTARAASRRAAAAR